MDPVTPPAAAPPAPVVPAAPAAPPAAAPPPAATPAAQADAVASPDTAALTARVASMEAAVKALLATEEAAIPEERKPLLELAPADPAERLAWLAKAKQRGLFAVAAAAPPPAPPANTRPVAPPAPGAAPPAQKSVLDMSPEEYRALKQRAASGPLPRA